MATTETVNIRPQPGAQEAFLSSSADIAIYGGAAGGGKSYALLLEAMRNTSHPNFGAVVLRRTTPEITGVGGLWEEAEKIYPLMGAEPRLGSLSWKFPSGARIKFDHMEHEQSKKKYQGTQIALICFDELTHFTQSQFWFMCSRNRSACGVRSYIRATCNPDANSFVRDLIDKDTGYAIEERSGIVRWFVRHGGELQWADAKEDLEQQFPGAEPKSMTFIKATLDDNPALTSTDPGYRASLLAMPYVERERYLSGNWNVVDAEGAEWQSEYFRDIYVDSLPENRLITVVALDPSLGKTDMATKTKLGDFSAFVAVAKGYDGRYYVDANLRKRNVRDIVEEGIEWMRHIRPDAFGCEFIGFQSVLGELFMPELPRAWLNGIFPIHTKESLGQKGRLPPKRVRIRTRLTQPLADGRIKFVRSPGTSLLIEQMRAFPIHRYDDGPDALEMAIRLCEDLLQGSGHEEKDEVLVA
jgi:hypothetical protein